MENFKENSIEQLLAELFARVAALEVKLVSLEKETNLGGVYLDGVPEHLKNFIEERRKARGNE